MNTLGHRACGQSAIVTAGLGTARAVHTELATRFGYGARFIAEPRAASEEGRRPNACAPCATGDCEAALAGRKQRTHVVETPNLHDQPMSDRTGVELAVARAAGTDTRQSLSLADAQHTAQDRRVEQTASAGRQVDLRRRAADDRAG
jgi:hypothetical protein